MRCDWASAAEEHSTEKQPRSGTDGKLAGGQSWLSGGGCTRVDKEERRGGRGRQANDCEEVFKAGRWRWTKDRERGNGGE